MKRIPLVLVLMVVAIATLVAGTVVADIPAVDEDPNGRIVAARGTLGSLTGTLRWERDEWYLATGNNGVYKLHLGPYGHWDEPLFTAGVTATTEGFIYGTHIAPLTVRSEGETHRFWNTDRMPLWAGSGEGAGRVAWHTDEVPRGQRRALRSDGEISGPQPRPRAFARDENQDLRRRFRN